MKLINTPNINLARKQIDSLSNNDKKVIVLSQASDEFNRKIIENKKVDVFLLNEDIRLRDYTKQRNSQFNEILCKLATKNNIKVAIDIEKIIKKNDIEKSKSLARLVQNITLCKKAKCELIFYKNSFNKKELQSLMLILGASTSQAKKSSEESFFN